MWDRLRVRYRFLSNLTRARGYPCGNCACSSARGDHSCFFRRGRQLSPYGVFKAEQGPVYPETGVLLQPLFNDKQQAVVPAGTPVMVQLYPSAQGVTIEAHSLVFGGKVVSIQASGSLIPSTAGSVSGNLAQVNLSQVDADTPYILTLGTEIPLNGHGAPLF